METGENAQNGSDVPLYSTTAPLGTKKSNAVPVFKSHWPDAFHDGAVQSHVADVTFEDCLQSLKSIGAGSLDPAALDDSCVISSGKHLLMSMKKSAESVLERTMCDTYVMCFDKYRYVPVVKGVEQTQRNKKNLKAEQENSSSSPGAPKRKNASVPKPRDPRPRDGISFQERRPYLVLDQPLPADWKGAMEDRQDTLQHVIALVCEMWLFSDDPDVRLCVPEGSSIILDGHCLSRAVLEKHGIIVPGNDDLDPYDVPICVGRNLFNVEPLTIYAREEEEGKPFLCPELTNQLGETDFVVFFLHRQLCECLKQPLSMSIFSTDTDMLFLSLVYTLKREGDVSIFWRYKPLPTWVFHDLEYVSRSQEKWVDIHALWSCMERGHFALEPLLPKSKPKRKRKLSKEEELKEHREEERVRKKCKTHLEQSQRDFLGLRSKTLSIIGPMIIAGGDYTTAYYGMTHERFMAAMLTFPTYIGDVIQARTDTPYGVQIDPRAYARLIKSTFMQARRVRMIDHQCSPQNTTVGAIVQETKKLAEQNRFPHVDTVCTRYRHALYYMRMLWQLGTSSIREPDPKLYAYAADDPGREMSRSNIVRVLLP